MFDLWLLYSLICLGFADKTEWSIPMFNAYLFLCIFSLDMGKTWLSLPQISQSMHVLHIALLLQVPRTCFILWNNCMRREACFSVLPLPRGEVLWTELWAALHAAAEANSVMFCISELGGGWGGGGVVCLFVCFFVFYCLGSFAFLNCSHSDHCYVML